jgi:hypothetical protein
MEISLAGLIGAVLGTIASAVIYGPLVGAIERRLRSKQQPEAEDRMALAQEIALLRRGVLAADMLFCAGMGYWIGQMIGG